MIHFLMVFLLLFEIGEEEKSDKCFKLRDTGYNLNVQSVKADEYYKVIFLCLKQQL